ncbi:IbrB-like domain-containing protein [Photobacterium damselae]|uniref:IbrB-like domain-containing protein n=1 Tax=Photobacterium damselae TaxID=38293 RepID=UPI001EFE10BD|nr:ParB/RepB/Spo0J family partition protein [Photobacterium damselae]MCG9780687.1 ParB/RepB/Spo0J family partition protein [Photobacterium damselae]
MDVNTLFSSLDSLDVKSLSLYDRVEIFNKLSDFSKKIIEFNHPVLNIKLIRSSLIKENDYNPNKVAPPEFKLLKHSINKDGVTMPVVVNKNNDTDYYTIIDGFHRSKLIKSDLEIKNSLAGYIPVVVLNKDNDECMSSSIRHNVARGSHQVELTAKLVMKLRDMNWSNETIGKEIGMDKDEVLRMQQVTGLAEAFKDEHFSSAWE